MGISVWQIALVALVVVVLFGAGRIPRMMGDMAKGIKSFKEGMKEDVPMDEASSDPDRLQKSDSAKVAEEKDRAANS
jgi:sec-independent protein translocase protein TatA